MTKREGRSGKAKGIPEVLKRGFETIAVVLLLFHPGAAQAQDYTFTMIADSNGPVACFLGWPAINASGAVAFGSCNTAAVRGVYSGEGGSLTTIADSTNSQIDKLGVQISINDEGQVAFDAGVGASNGTEVAFVIYAGDGGPLASVVDTRGAFRWLRGAAINSDGAVAFIGVPHGNIEGVFVHVNERLAAVVNSSGFYKNFFSVAINRTGVVAFSARTDDGMTAVIAMNGLRMTPIADSGGMIKYASSPPSLNAGGTVAFRAELDSGDKVIFTGSGGDLSRIAGTQGPYREFRSHVSINDRGMVAFVAFLDDGYEGLFTGPDPSKDKVIAYGDPLFGSELKNLKISSEAINDSGQIAFYAKLIDGTTGIYRAEPTASPTLEQQAEGPEDSPGN